MSSQTDFASCSPISHSHLPCFAVRTLVSLWHSWPGSRQPCWKPSEQIYLVSHLIKECASIISKAFLCTLAHFNLLILCQRASRGIFFSWLVSIKADISTASFTLSELLQSISFLLKNSVPSLLLKFFLYKWFLAYFVTSDYCGNVFHSFFSP